MWSETSRVEFGEHAKIELHYMCICPLDIQAKDAILYYKKTCARVLISRLHTTTSQLNKVLSSALLIYHIDQTSHY